ncbi:MAG: hypothetical protein ABEJ72_04895, partial [Candidatus Aenigmatarchaeota archaeon]
FSGLGRLFEGLQPLLQLVGLGAEIIGHSLAVFFKVREAMGVDTPVWKSFYCSADSLDFFDILKTKAVVLLP